jgi:hypothetical protein
VPASSARATSFVALYALLPVCKEAGRAHAGAHSLLDQGRARGYALCAVQKGKTGQRTRRALYNKHSVRVHEGNIHQYAEKSPRNRACAHACANLVILRPRALSAIVVAHAADAMLIGIFTRCRNRYRSGPFNGHVCSRVPEDSLARATTVPGQEATHVEVSPPAPSATAFWKRGGAQNGAGVTCSSHCSNVPVCSCRQGHQMPL